MPTELILGFNGGEVSRNIESRIDLDLYKKSASFVENFDLLPEGGARNRAGTKFITKTAGDIVSGDQPAHLMKFSYSDEYSYIFEFGNQYIRIFNVQTEEIIDTLVSPYGIEDALTIQFERSYDTMWLTHPSYPEQTIVRDEIDSFSITQTTYDFPPFLDQNKTPTTLTAGARTGTGVSLVSSDDLFLQGHVGSQWLIKQLRTSTNIVSGVEFGPSVNSTGAGVSASSTWLNAGFSDLTFTTDNTWNGRLSVQVSYDGGTTVDELLFIGDTTGGASKNYADDISSRLSANAIVRFHWENLTGALVYSLRVIESYNFGLVTITSVTDAQNAVCDVVSDLYDTSPTTSWSEGAFSEVNGYPRTCRLFEERKWYCGTKREPNVLIGSRTDDFYDYFIGTRDDEAIKRSPLVNGDASWLSSKEELFIGTTNEVLVVSGLVSSQGLTPSNIKFNIQSSDGADYMQSELVNDVVIYTQKGQKKLRELIYDDGNKTFLTNDLSALSKHIAKIGIESIELQKLPDQRIYCILSNGQIGILAYERSEDVIAWFRYSTDGDYKSVAIAQNGSEDSVWYVIERDGEFFIEVQQSRDNTDLFWHLDSGAESISEGIQSSTNIEIENSLFCPVIFNKTDHGLSDGDLIKTSNMSNSDMDQKIYSISDTTPDSFKLKSSDASQYIDYCNIDSVEYNNVSGKYNGAPPAYIIVSDAPNTDANGRYEFVNINDDSSSIYTKGFWDIQFAGSEFAIMNTEFAPIPYYQNSDTNIKGNIKIPPTSDWYTFSGSPVLTPLEITYYGETILNGDFKQVYNKVEELGHLEGKTVSAVGDNKYLGEYTVEGGKITFDEYVSSAVAGLPFKSTLSPLPIDLVNQIFTVGNQKTVSSIDLKLKDSVGGSVGTDLSDMEPIVTRLLTDPIGYQEDLVNDDIQIYSQDSWDDIKRLYVQQCLPLPFEVLSLSLEVKSGGK